MSVEKYDIRWYGSANMPDDDVTTEIGGAIDTSIKLTFGDLTVTDAVKAVSSNAGDTTQSIEVHGRRASLSKVSETIDLNGQTPAQAASPIDFARLLKCVKSATCAGDVAIMSTTNNNTGTAQGAGDHYIDLAAGASAVDDAYNDQVIRITSGTGQYQLNMIVDYDGTSKRATVSNDWSTPPTDGVYEIADGMLLDKAPSEIMECRRDHYNEAAEGEGGANFKTYDKGFAKNCHATLALSDAVISEVAGGIAAKEAFGLAASIDDSGTNGVGNTRHTAPATIVFDSAAKSVPGDNLEPGEAIGVWFELSLDAGDAAANSFYTLEVSGKTG